MKKFPKTADPLVVRTDFENERAWNAICEQLRTPNSESGMEFGAHVEFLEDLGYSGFTKEQLVAAVPVGYAHSFFLVVDAAAVTNPEFPILVVDLGDTRGGSFRAIPSQIQGIQNNLSIGNMGFEEFADAVDEDGVFRGFPRV